MIIFKNSFYLLLSVIFIVSAFASPEPEEVRKQLFSEDPSQRQLALNYLIRTGEAHTFNPELIAMALYEDSPSVRVKAREALASISEIVVEGGKIIVGKGTRLSEQSESNGFRLYIHKDRLILLQEALSSVVPDEQIKALRSLKKDMREAYHPFIQYMLLREIVFKSVDEVVLRELMYITISNSVMQQWLVRIATADAVSDTVRSTARDILIGINPDLKNQRELVRIAISNKASDIARSTARDILVKTRLYPETQQDLVNVATSTADYADASDAAQKRATYILKKANPDRKLAEMAVDASRRAFTVRTFLR